MEEKNKLSIPFAIIIAGALIAGAVFFVNRNGESPVVEEIETQTFGEEFQEPRPVSDSDHVLGNPNADIIIIEYSDTECPFCKNFHSTLHTIIDEYGKDGRVAWVYRHFPLEQLHSKAPKEAEALECAAEFGGNDGFWAYADRLYEITPSNDGLNLSQLPEIAVYVGLDRNAFESCLDSGRYASHVQSDFEEAVATGGRGTPHSLILFEGEIIPITGAQPLSALRSIIEGMLGQ